MCGKGQILTFHSVLESEEGCVAEGRSTEGDQGHHTPEVGSAAGLEGQASLHTLIPLWS